SRSPIPAPLPALVFAQILEIGVDDVVIDAARPGLAVLVGRGALGLAGLVDGLAQLHRGIHHVLDGAADLAGILGLDGLLQRADGQLDRLDGRAVNLVAMLVQRLAGAVDQAFGLVAQLDQLAAGLVGLGIGLGV